MCWGRSRRPSGLATRYGADVEKARVAALLHDCTKKLDMPEQLALCRQYGIELDELEQKALKLLHAKTGAAIAREVFGVDDEIYRAIWWHTTGHADMTLLEKIIYLADYIEPSRDFPGVNDLRACVYEDLDRGTVDGTGNDHRRDDGNGKSRPPRYNGGARLAERKEINPWQKMLESV